MSGNLLKKYILNWGLFLGLFFVLTLNPLVVFANLENNPTSDIVNSINAHDLVISEINWAGSSKSYSDEWIELYNPTNEDIILNDYEIEGASSKKLAFGPDLIYTIPSKGYFLISNYSQGDKSDLGVSPDFIDTGLSISNKLIDIKLINTKLDAEKQIVDRTLSKQEPINPSQFLIKDTVSSIQRTNNLEWVNSNISINVTDPLHLASPQNSLLKPEKYPTPNIKLEKLNFNYNQIDQPKYIAPVDYPGKITNHNWIIYNKDCKKIVEKSGDTLFENLPVGDYCLGLYLESSYKSIKHVFDYRFQISIYEDDILTPIHPIKKGDLLINEIMPFGDEYIEIYNNTNRQIDLSNLIISDRVGKINQLTVPKGTKINSGAYLIVSLSSRLSLNDDGDGIILFDNLLPEVILDEINYVKSNNKNFSYQKSKLNEWWWSTPTPGNTNSSYITQNQISTNNPTNQDLSYLKGKIYINEVMISGDEYIELFNSTNQVLQISEMYVQDSAGKTKKSKIPSFEMKPTTYLIINLKKLVSLNDSGDSVILLDYFGNVIDKVAVPKNIDKKSSWQLINGKWSWQNSTPGTRNFISPSNAKCQYLQIYGRTSKNQFQSSIGQLSIKNIDPNKYNNQIILGKVCNLRRLKSGLTADSLVISNSISGIKFYNFDDNTEIKNNQLIKFSLSCSESEKFKLIRNDLSLRNFFNSKIKFNCSSGQINGLGLARQMSSKAYIHVYAVSSSPEQSKVLINTEENVFENRVYLLIKLIYQWLEKQKKLVYSILT